jgi:hypothetical protein
MISPDRAFRQLLANIAPHHVPDTSFLVDNFISDSGSLWPLSRNLLLTILSQD